MSTRRFWLTSVIAACAGLLVRPAEAQQGVGFNPTQLGRGAASLSDQLIRGLRATTDEQQQYLTNVAAAVEAGQLPRGLVNLVFRWAIERNPRVPFPYFQYALKALAKRQGINV